MFGLSDGQVESILYYARESYTTWWISDKIKKDWNVNVSPKSIKRICDIHNIEVQTTKKLKSAMQK